MTKQIKLISPSEELTLASRGYKLIKKIGEGSYSNVYLAEFLKKPDHKDKNKDVEVSAVILACKLIDTEKAPRDFVIKFLPREIDILARLSHPHIIHIHSIFQRKTKYFIFMRNAEHGDLLDFILKKGSISEAQSRVWIRQIALALQYLHEMDIAHRDLKCENVLITMNYNLKLADFGFARFVVDANGRKTLAETYCGSLSYAAPEILRGKPYFPKISDIWSLGIILYIMLNKSMPFDDSNIRQLYDQQIHKRWKFRSKVVNLLTTEIKKLLTQILEPDVTKRLTIEQVLASDWLVMDARLKFLTQAEQTALSLAQVERQKYLDELKRQSKQEKRPKQEDAKLIILRGKGSVHSDSVVSEEMKT